MKSVYLDTNIFLYPLLYDNAKAKACKIIITQIVKKEIKGYTSILTWDELVYTLSRLVDSETAKKEGALFLQMPNLEIIDANKKIVALAQSLVSTYPLKPRDAIHAATALTHGISEIISDDADLDKVKELKRIGPERFV